MPPSVPCPHCGTARPADAPGDCPGCLMRLGLERPSADSTVARAPVLDTIGETIGPVPRVLLRDTTPGEEPSPIVHPDGRPPDPTLRYRIDGEIARGGMGAVLKGRDPDLGRDVALKVLRENLKGNADLVRRFVEEAQIGGQLQHPGIVPIYELGTLADRRPFFSMKLVKGHTLAQLLAQRPGPAAELPRFLSIFEAIGQTVAYAHARGVIHRDLKPSNVMVGSFGEVQVMDWGLAKVLPRGGVVDDASAGRLREETVIATARSGSDTDLSRAGSILGTPAYMAPEQARGETEALDERADVFALGSLLCEILTGLPAFTGRSSAEMIRKASRGDLAEAQARLDACAADPELVALARDCLAAEREDRPRDAGVVAERVTAYLTGVQERLRGAERERAVAEARATEERKRRRLQLGLVASLLGLSVVGGLGFTYVLQQRQERAAAIDRLLGEARTLYGVALKQPEDASRWDAVLAALRQAEAAIGQGVDANTTRPLATLRQDAQSGADAARRDEALLDAVAEVRSRKQDLGPAGADEAYARAFHEAGLDVDALTPAEVGARLKPRPASVVIGVAAALDDWALVLREGRPTDDRWRRPLEAAREADPDPFRNRLRGAVLEPDKGARQATLRGLVEATEAADLPPASAVLLATSLEDHEAAVRLLRAATGRHPNDVWVNYKLAERLGRLRPAPRDEQVRYYTAARAVRPETAHELAHLLDQMGRGDEALRVFADLTDRRPADARHLACYGRCLQRHGRPAAAILERAVDAGREAIRLKPGYAGAHDNLGNALAAQGRPAEAAAESREAIRLKPDYAEARYNLGLILRRQGDLAGAVAELRKGHELGSKQPGWSYPSGQRLRDAERLAALANRLPALLRGDEQLRDNADRLGVAQICYDTQRHAAAARFWAEALEDDPKLGDDRQAQHRYNAACAAALAAAGKGADDPPPDDETKARLRSWALGWLKAERDAWAKLLDDGPPQARPVIARILAHWKADADLAGIRDAEALAELPEAERAEWEALWAEVGRLLGAAGKP